MSKRIISAVHADANVGHTQRWCVIDTVAHEAHQMTAGTQSPHDALLVQRSPRNTQALTMPSLATMGGTMAVTQTMAVSSAGLRQLQPNFVATHEPRRERPVVTRVNRLTRPNQISGAQCRLQSGQVFVVV